MRIIYVSRMQSPLCGKSLTHRLSPSPVSLRKIRDNIFQYFTGIYVYHLTIKSSKNCLDKTGHYNKAYKEIKSPKVSESITPEQQIDKLDKRITDIDKMIESLQTEKSEIIKKRSTIFYGLEIKCPVKYRWIKGNYFSEYPSWWKCQIYIENNGVEEVFGNYSVYSSEHPDTFWKNREDIKGFDREKIPEKYVNDFRMVWKQAHDELMKIQKEKDKKDEEELQKAMESAKKQDDIMKKVINMIPDDDDKVILKKFYRVLANTYHPDNEKTGDADMMQYVNDLKQIWGI